LHMLPGKDHPRKADSTVGSPPTAMLAKCPASSRLSLLRLA
jgi:hypothetical protein